MNRPLVLAFAALPLVATTACSSPSESPSRASDSQAADVSADPARDPSPAARADRTTSVARTDADDADTAVSAAQVPLTPGVYVLEGTGCENPANAAWRVWDGTGLSGSATERCRAEVLSSSGDDYTIRNSCVNTYDGSRTPETLTLSVTDQVHFTVNGNNFQSCSTAQVPEFLRQRLEG